MPGLSVESLPAPWRRRLLAGGLALGVLAAHWMLLAWGLPAWFDLAEAPPQSAPHRVVYRVALAPLPPTSPPTRAPAPAAQAPAPSTRPTTPMPEPDSTPAGRVAPAAAPALDADAVAETVAAPPAADLPVYAPRLPQAATWRYRMERGPLSGQATLNWSPQPDGRYEARLEGRAGGLTLLEWVSQGVVDASGAAPDRFALRRRGRDRQAANFQRDAGKITFSGPTHELPLWPGAQDRLSWLVQLAGVLEAEPAQRQAGARTTLMVIGARGGAERWSFVVQGGEPIAGRPALRLLRDTDRRHETKVEVWLDPAQGYRPLRAVLATIEGGPPLVLEVDAEAEAGAVPARP
ncbi:MAG TPA: DUF3108 domain-containing protein [Burkholderiaceae bacterium]|nr:DUF3108 domain-containing protein [Burkholderiaceae bacterium]